MVYKMNESIIVIQAEAINPIQTNVVFWSHDRGTAKLRMKLVRKDGIPQSLPEGTTVPIRLMFRSATAEGGYGKHDYLATIDDRVNGIVSIMLEDNILGYVGTVEGSIYIDFPDSRSLDTAGRFTFSIKRSPIDDSTPELEDYYFNGFSQTIDKIEKILADGKQEIDQKIAESETQIDAKLKDTNDKITKANQDVATLDQNLTELRNDMKLSEAWAWSKDGTDRFTTKYPKENVLNQTAFNEKGSWTFVKPTGSVSTAIIEDGVAKIQASNDFSANWKHWEMYINPTDTAYDKIKTLSERKSSFSVSYRIPDITYVPSGGPKAVLIILKTNSGINILEKYLTVKDIKVGVWDRMVLTQIMPNISMESEKFRIIIETTLNNCPEIQFDDLKLEAGDASPYVPAPSEDYENAYPQYRGLALLPSDLPNDYSWDITPEYTEKGLNDTVSLTEPQSVEGLKNFADGIQIAGDKVISENDCTVYTLTKDNSQSFIDGYATFIKHGKIVIVNGTVKFKKAYAFGVPLDDEVPEEFIARGVNGMIIGASGTSNSAKMIYVRQDFKSIMTNSEFAINEWFTFNGVYWVGEE